MGYLWYVGFCWVLQGGPPHWIGLSLTCMNKLGSGEITCTLSETNLGGFHGSNNVPMNARTKGFPPQYRDFDYFNCGFNDMADVQMHSIQHVLLSSFLYKSFRILKNFWERYIKGNNRKPLLVQRLCNSIAVRRGNTYLAFGLNTQHLCDTAPSQHYFPQVSPEDLCYFTLTTTLEPSRVKHEHTPWQVSL